MSWKETCVEEQRLLFIAQWLQHEASMSVLCREFGISRKTGYQLVDRYTQAGVSGLRDRSRAPLAHPNAVSPEMEQRILQARATYSTWGAAKLRSHLLLREPETPWPAASTVGDVLQRHGLTVPRRPRPRTPPSPLAVPPLAHATAPNSLWTIDFKGWFRTGDGQICYPLTVCDAYSRYLLRLQALRQTGIGTVRPLLEATFREYGLPWAIRSDNGPPFASTGLGGLTKLSVWWLKLGIRHERIAPGRPDQNGRHERMHRTLGEEVEAQANQRRQQHSYGDFRGYWNDERPHQGLDQGQGQQTPGSLYVPSPRLYPRRLPEVCYPASMLVRRVRSNGEIRWQCGLSFVSEALIGEWVGLQESDSGQWSLYFMDQALAVWDPGPAKWQSPLPRRTRRSGVLHVPAQDPAVAAAEGLVP